MWSITAIYQTSNNKIFPNTSSDCQKDSDKNAENGRYAVQRWICIFNKKPLNPRVFPTSFLISSLKLTISNHQVHLVHCYGLFELQLRLSHGLPSHYWRTKGPVQFVWKLFFLEQFSILNLLCKPIFDQIWPAQLHAKKSLEVRGFP